MTFATYSRGYKGLAYDLTSTLTTRSLVAGVPLADAIAANQPVPPETVDSYEIGFKGTFFDSRVIWNITAFHMIFEGFQAQSRDQVLNQNLLNSIGKVTSRGVETEVAARFGDLTFNGGGAYNSAIMDDFPNAGCFTRQTAAEGCVGNVQDLSGKPLFNAPKWNFNVNAQYDMPADRQRADAVRDRPAIAGNRKSSSTCCRIRIRCRATYGIANLGGGVRGDRWKLTGFVNNVFDKSYALTIGRDAHINVPAGGNAVELEAGTRQRALLRRARLGEFLRIVYSPLREAGPHPASLSGDPRQGWGRLFFKPTIDYSMIDHVLCRVPRSLLVVVSRRDLRRGACADGRRSLTGRRGPHSATARTAADCNCSRRAGRCRSTARRCSMARTNSCPEKLRSHSRDLIAALPADGSYASRNTVDNFRRIAKLTSTTQRQLGHLLLSLGARIALNATDGCKSHVDPLTLANCACAWIGARSSTSTTSR